MIMVTNERMNTGDRVADERSAADHLLQVRVVRLVDLEHLAIITGRRTEFGARERCVQERALMSRVSLIFDWKEIGSRCLSLNAHTTSILYVYDVRNARI